MSQSTDVYGVADYLSVTVATVRSRIRAGTFPNADATENGVDWWTLETLDKYVRAQKRKKARRQKKGS